MYSKCISFSKTPLLAHKQQACSHLHPLHNNHSFNMVTNSDGLSSAYKQCCIRNSGSLLQGMWGGVGVKELSVIPGR